MELRRREYSAALSFRAPFGRIGVLSGLAVVPTRVVDMERACLLVCGC